MRLRLLVLPLLIVLAVPVLSQQKGKHSNLPQDWWTKVDMDKQVVYGEGTSTEFKIRQGAAAADYDHVRLLSDQIEELKKELKLQEQVIGALASRQLTVTAPPSHTIQPEYPKLDRNRQAPQGQVSR